MILRLHWVLVLGPQAIKVLLPLPTAMMVCLPAPPAPVETARARRSCLDLLLQTGEVEQEDPVIVTVTSIQLEVGLTTGP